MQWLLQEHERRLDEDRAQKRARTLPSLARLPLGVRVTPATAAPTLKELVLRTTRHYRPASVGTALPPHRLADGRFGSEAHLNKCYSAT
eukprot:1140021-Pyramimonas_sp.AAC.1